MDRVKPLKIESAQDGTQEDPFPTETDPQEDYLAAKGIAFENLETYLMEKLGRTLTVKIPNFSIKPTLLPNKNPDYIEFFESNVQITANRIARVDYSYNPDLTPSSESVKIYDSDGTTILRTITYTYTYSASMISNVEVSFT